MKEPAELDETKVPEDMVFFGKGFSAPHDLYVRGRRLYRLFWIAALSPLALLIVYGLTPKAAVMAVAELFNVLFWAHFKQISLQDCAATCQMMAYTVVAIPLSWFATVLVALWAVPLTIQNWKAGREAFRRGAAPYGRLANGGTRQPPGYKISVVVGIPGSDRTITRGREIPTVLIDIWITLIMGLTQFFAAALMMVSTNVALSFRKLLRS
jgi:hypothetical protein